MRERRGQDPGAGADTGMGMGMGTDTGPGPGTGTGTDAGSGSVLAVGIVGAVTALAGLAIPLYMGLAVRQSVAAAADSAALAAADVLVGIEPGFPCDAASRAAAANGASLSSCEPDGLVVTVTAARSVFGIPVVARATAGPPPGEPD